ncbi:hypothetical protein DFH29DRAFT_873972 [Suillus ampliporus]|nr:hypothetical protein DFH29DRAFT_873972 [Suillus ampliporus]
MTSTITHNTHIGCYLHDEQLPAIMPFFGDFVGLQGTFHFIGYLVIGPQPTLYPFPQSSTISLETVQSHIKLYAYLETGIVHMSIFKLHQSTDVLVYTLVICLPGDLGRGAITNYTLYMMVWTSRAVIKPSLILPSIHSDISMRYTKALSSLMTFQAQVSVHTPPTSTLQSWMTSDAGVVYEDDPSDKSNYEPYEIKMAPRIAVPVQPDHPHIEIPAEIIAPHETVSHGDDTLQRIMLVYPTWTMPLGYLRLLMRVVICTGQTENPHTITKMHAENKIALIHTLWAESMKRANTTLDRLETVISIQGGAILSLEDILLKAGSWLSQFIYDINHTVNLGISHPTAGFGIHEIFGVLLIAELEDLLANFANGFFWVMRSEFAKALLWHIVFRNAQHPPADTLAFVGSSGYGALLRKLKTVVAETPGASMSQQYPSARQVHNELVETTLMLFAQHDDPGLEMLMNCMSCLVSPQLVADGRSLSSSWKAPQCAYRSIAFAWGWLHYLYSLYFQYNVAPLSSTCLAIHSKSHLKNLRALEKSLIAIFSQIFRKFFATIMADMRIPWYLGSNNWGPILSLCLQLPDSLFITASMLFGLVDLHDLKVLLDHEEDSCIAFLRQGGHCLMEERMYRAQLEVLLFSKAIANLCEELNTRSQPVTWCLGQTVKLITVNGVGQVGACQAPRSVNFDCFQPTKAVQDKCHAWLLTSSDFEDTPLVSSNTSWTPPDSPQPHEALLRHDNQFLSLPRLMKAWVDNVTYCAYISASFAEANEPLCTDNSHRLTAKESKTLNVLKSDFHILYLKKQRAQAEADMFSEAISHSAEFESTHSGSSGTAPRLESRPPDVVAVVFLPQLKLCLQSQIQWEPLINHGVATTDHRSEAAARWHQDGVEDVYMFLDDLEGNSEAHQEREELPTAVITSLTRCYASSCSEDHPCYLFACPHQFKLVESLIWQTEDWLSMVDPAILHTLPESEVHRQIIIYKTITQEEQYIQDLDTVEACLRWESRTYHERVDIWISVHVPSHVSIFRSFMSFGKSSGTNESLAEILDTLVGEQELSGGTREFRFAYPTYIGHLPLAENVSRTRIESNVDLRLFLKKYPIALEAIMKETTEGNVDTYYLAEAIEAIRSLRNVVQLRMFQTAMCKGEMYIRDLENIETIYIQALREMDPPVIPRDRLNNFIGDVFHNFAELHSHHRKLLDQLHEIQREEYPTIRSITAPMFDAALNFRDAYM